MPKTTSDTPEFVQKSLARFEKNNKYLKEHMPNLYRTIEGRDLTKCRLDILHEIREFDLLEERRSLYPEGASKQALEESCSFLNQLAIGAPLTTVAPATPGLYDTPRFFARHLNKTICDTFPRIYRRTYPIPNFFFFGLFYGDRARHSYRRDIKQSRMPKRCNYRG